MGRNENCWTVFEYDRIIADDTEFVTPNGRALFYCHLRRKGEKNPLCGFTIGQQLGSSVAQIDSINSPGLGQPRHSWKACNPEHIQRADICDECRLLHNKELGLD